MNVLHDVLLGVISTTLLYFGMVSPRWVRAYMCSVKTAMKLPAVAIAVRDLCANAMLHFLTVGHTNALPAVCQDNLVRCTNVKELLQQVRGGSYR